MGLRDVRAAAIRAIREGRVQHEARGDVDEKNLFLTGDVTGQQIISLLEKCRGDQYASSPHHFIRDVVVHVFRPEGALVAGGPRNRWYVKLYFLEPEIWFISVHTVGKERVP